jgi:hypothetical protein
VLVCLDHVASFIADNLSKADWSWGCVSAVDSEGRTLWIVDAHRDDGNRFVALADDKPTAFLELARMISAYLLTEGEHLLRLARRVHTIDNYSLHQPD